MKLVFKTKRMNVFMETLTPADFNTPRMIFLGFLHDRDLPRVAVNAMVNFPIEFSDGSKMPHYIDWIETSESLRLEGLAKELWQGMEGYLKAPIEGDGASVGGDALCDAMETEHAASEKSEKSADGV
jgi:hypothetical protein